jgi:hypothetical protein
MNNNTNDSIIGDLFSIDQSIVLKTLSEISFTGKTHYIPVLIEILHSTDNQEVKQAIVKILSELKITNAVPVLVEAINNPNYKAIQEILVRICWENGLNFSPHLSTFVDLAIHADYMTSFEAITVIENSEGEISEEEAQSLIATIKNSIEKVPSERKILLSEIISFLPTLI